MFQLWPGVALALGSAVLFGANAPASKALVSGIEPQMLAGLLYLGAGVGLAFIHLMRRALGLDAPEAPLRMTDLPWLLLVILFGGVIGPVLLMFGLSLTTASSASLLLNLESVFTIFLAYIVFREYVDRQLAVGAFGILLGAVVLSWDGQGVSFDSGAALVGGACLCWALDNNLTRKLSSADPVIIATWKGLLAGTVNTGLALSLGAQMPSTSAVAISGVVGFFSVGVSLVMFILALRYLGTARTGAYFSLAPFVGAVFSIVFLGEPFTLKLLIAGLLMALGLWLHLAERHDHDHRHESLSHEHGHIHDEHHAHDHAEGVEVSHSHWHVHQPMQHAHRHYPDIHHRHDH